SLLLTPPTPIAPLSLHVALPIFPQFNFRTLEVSDVARYPECAHHSTLCICEGHLRCRNVVFRAILQHFAFDVVDFRHAGPHYRLLVFQRLPGMHLILEVEVRLADEIGGVFSEMGGEVLRSEEHTSELQSRENLVC